MLLRQPNFHRHRGGWLPPNQHCHRGVLQCSWRSFWALFPENCPSLMQSSDSHLNVASSRVESSRRHCPPSRTHPLPHSEATGLPVQQGQSRHCNVLRETVVTVSLRQSHIVACTPYSRANSTLSRHQSHHVTDDAEL